MPIITNTNRSRIADYTRLSFLGELHARFNPPCGDCTVPPPSNEWKQQALAALAGEDWAGPT
jgi:hypothetical protein